MQLKGIDPRHFLVFLYNILALIKTAGLGGVTAARYVLL